MAVSSASDRRLQRPATPGVWAPFVRAAVSLTLLVGFGLGGALFAAPLVGLPLGGWWRAAAQVHGHVQLFGWAGLMVLGIGLEFLPRLRGRPLQHPERSRTVVGLLVAGLVLRTLLQPWLALSDPLAPYAPVARSSLLLSGVFELMGATAAVALLVSTMRGEPPLRSRQGAVQILPFLVAAFSSLWLGLVANLVSVAALAFDNSAASGRADHVSVLLGLYGFLVPVSAAMGIRLFPLHFAAQLPHVRLLAAGLVCLLAGLALRLAGEVMAEPWAQTIGLLLVATGLVTFVMGLRVFAPRRPVPGQRPPWFADAAQWHGLTACAWLLVDAVLLALTALAAVEPRLGRPPLEAEQHIVGAGFITLLILGEGAKLLPGFARRPLRSEALVWTTLALGNFAVALRVAPVLLTSVVSGTLGQAMLALSGLVGLVAVAIFAINVAGVAEPTRPRSTQARPHPVT